MSAIFGIYSRDGSQGMELLEKAAQVMSYHAVDGLSYWKHHPGAQTIALAHAMTWLSPESKKEKLPFYDEPAQQAVTADVRLDNRAELLHVLGIPDPSTPDSVILLRAYQAWGDECPQHLLGDFCFVIWDGRRQKIFAARDQLGIRPLFYSAGAGRLAFASDMAGMLELLHESPYLDLEYLVTWFHTPNRYQHGRTWYSNIASLPPAQAFSFDANGLRVWEYWKPEDAPAIEMKNEHEYIAALRDLLEKSVQARLRCEYPIGAHLSGGLDSSSVAVLAGRTLKNVGQSLTAFTWSPPVQSGEILHPNDERKRLLSICSNENLPLFFTQVSPASDAYLDTCDPSLLPANTLRHEFPVMQKASSEGIRLLLSGWGGDEFISYKGRGYLRELFLKKQWRSLARSLFSRAGYNPIKWIYYTYTEILLFSLPASIREYKKYSRFSSFSRNITPQLLPVLKRKQQRLSGAEKFTGAIPAPGFFTPDFYRRLETAAHETNGDHHHQHGIHPQHEAYTSIREAQIASLRNGHLALRTESWGAHAARLGLQYAYPLLDRRIVEFTLGLPVRLFKGPRGQNRYIFRLALEGILPPEIQWASSKVDSALALAANRSDDYKADLHSIRQPALAALLARSPRSTDWIDFDYLNRMLETPPGKRNPELAHGIWQILSLAFIDSRAILKEE